MTGMEVVALAAVAGSAAIGAASSVMGGIEANKQAQYNARVAEISGQQALSAAGVEAGQKRKATERLQGTVRARAAANGLEVGDGSPLEVLLENASEGELDALWSEHAGKVADSRYRSQATLDRRRGKQAEFAGYVGAAQQVLGAAAGAYKMYGGSTGTGASMSLTPGGDSYGTLSRYGGPR